MHKLTILGAGESGIGAALLAKKLGYKVFVSDFGKIKETFKEELERNALPYEEGKHTWQMIYDADEVVKSPGIPDGVPVVRQLREAGIPVVSEIEFAARHTNASVVAITGSNGKTTTTYLTHHLLQTAGKNVGIGGNVGTSLARQLARGDQFDIWVLELSSFQLDGIVDFRPDAAVVLNITPDHLDRYGYQLENYARSKMRIARNQTANDLLLLNRTLQNRPELATIRSEVELVDEEHFPYPDILEANGLKYDLRGTAIQGPHNRFNAFCALRVARRMGADADRLQEGLRSFRAVPHRLEPVGEIDGVRYVNDSKATNVDAVKYALLATPAPIIWIAGGTDKGNDYTELMPLVHEKVKALICLGLDNTKLKSTFGDRLDIHEVRSASAAVETAHSLAVAGDTVLLSPACASFDLFKNYEDRGEQYSAAVLRICDT